MNLHEYQGKEILSKHGVRVQRGYLAHTVEESISSAKKIYNLTKIQLNQVYENKYFHEPLYSEYYYKS